MCGVSKEDFENIMYNDVSVSSYSGCTDRLYVLLGYIACGVGSLGFIKSVHDHKGMLTVEVYAPVYKGEYEKVIRAAWESVREYAVEIVLINPCSGCVFFKK